MSASLICGGDKEGVFHMSRGDMTITKSNHARKRLLDGVLTSNRVLVSL